MSNLRKAAEMALEALEKQHNWMVANGGMFQTPSIKAIQALRQALEQPKQNIGALGMPVTVPVTPPKRKWIGLTDEEAWEVYRKHGLSFHRPNHVEEYEWALCMRDFARDIEAKLKEKNA